MYMIEIQFNTCDVWMDVWTDAAVGSMDNILAKQIH